MVVEVWGHGEGGEELGAPHATVHRLVPQELRSIGARIRTEVLP